jgi:type VI secretion system protein
MTPPPGAVARVLEPGSSGPVPTPVVPVLDSHASLLDNLLALATPPGQAPPVISDEARPFVATLAGMLDAFARGLLELKRGYQELGADLGVRAIGAHTPLHKSQSSLQALGYLLDPRADTAGRLEELVDLFADFVIHEVALLNGLKEGIRALVDELDPEGGYARTGAKSGGVLGALDRSLRRYKQHFDDVTEDGAERTVLGSAFAEAYAEAMGSRPGSGGRRD